MNVVSRALWWFCAATLASCLKPFLSAGLRQFRLSPAEVSCILTDYPCETLLRAGSSCNFLGLNKLTSVCLVHLPAGHADGPCIAGVTSRRAPRAVACPVRSRQPAARGAWLHPPVSRSQAPKSCLFTFAHRIRLLSPSALQGVMQVPGSAAPMLTQGWTKLSPRAPARGDVATGGVAFPGVSKWRQTVMSLSTADHVCCDALLDHQAGPPHSGAAGGAAEAAGLGLSWACYGGARARSAGTTWAGNATIRAAVS